MARSPDLKSVVRKDVRVRLPLSAPLSTFSTSPDKFSLRLSFRSEDVILTPA